MFFRLCCSLTKKNKKKQYNKSHLIRKKHKILLFFFGRKTLLSHQFDETLKVLYLFELFKIMLELSGTHIFESWSWQGVAVFLQFRLYFERFFNQTKFLMCRQSVFFFFLNKT